MIKLEAVSTEITKEVEKKLEARLVYHVFDGNLESSIRLVQETILTALSCLIFEKRIDMIKKIASDSESESLDDYRRVKVYIDPVNHRMLHFTYWYQHGNERIRSIFKLDTAFWDNSVEPATGKKEEEN